MKTLLALCSVLFISSLSFGQGFGYNGFSQDEVQTLKQIQIKDTNFGSLLPPKDSSGEYKTQHIKGIWSGSYWPMVQGGITSRWQRKEQPFAKIPTYDEISKMTKAQKNTLSAAEKYDYIMGDRGMSLTKAESEYLTRNAGPKIEEFYNLLSNYLASNPRPDFNNFKNQYLNDLNSISTKDLSLIHISEPTRPY